MLHGRGSGAEEFADELMESRLSDGRNLREALLGWRWVFPSSRELWSETFEEYMPAWFEARSLTDITARQDLQIEGIEASVEYVKAVLEEERERVGWRPERLVLGGISQGGAVGIWTLLSMGETLSKGPGAYVGASSWIPFGDTVERILGIASVSDPAVDAPRGEVESQAHPVDAGVAHDTHSGSGHHPSLETKTETRPFDSFVFRMMKLTDDGKLTETPHPGIPVLLGHGVDDAYVDVDLGRQAARLLSRAGHKIDWREYSGAEQEGHWFQVPNQMDHLYEFLQEQG